jgi:Isocitrate/isopropylmalate dehydrogenase
MLTAAFDTRPSASMSSSPGNDSCTAATDFVLVVNQKGKQAMTSPYRIAAIPGDGMGTEVMRDGLRVLETVGWAFDIDFAFEHFDCASADYYTTLGQMLPDSWSDQLRQFGAIFLEPSGP